MRFRMLGQLQVRVDAGWSTIRAAQPRVVLAVLLTESGQVVSGSRLVAEIWGDHPPRTAVNTIQGYVARLRRLLGADPAVRLVTRGRGYQLVVEDGEVDSRVFEQLVDSGQRHLLGGRVSAGADQLAAGLALWQGPALSDVPASPAVTSEANRLEQRRLTAWEARLGAGLAIGHHAEIADELHRLVDEYPLREQLRCHLMLALYRCGRRAEALEVYRRGRTVLVDELGVEPGPELRELERAILGNDPRLALVAGSSEPVPTRITPAQLPADIEEFTGRVPALRRLDELLPPAGEASGAVRIAIVAGSPGVGKTALAVHWAHRVRDRFADGQLYANLRGHADGPPVRPVEALARFLHALGVPAEQVPTDAEEATGLYRSLLADRRVLVLLDDAHHPDQVRPLLPGAPGCLVLVTSRAAMSGLVARDGAHSLRLDVLAEPEAHLLLSRLLGAGRFPADSAAVAELAALCDHMPLALRIAAANLGAGRHRTMAGYLERLRAGDRLAALQVEGDEQAAVRATFDLSYAALPGDARRLFRLLGLVPCAEVTVESAAALAASTHPETERLLARLADAHLVNEHTAGRYGLHDLLRAYARERSENLDGEQERELAVRRFYGWYLHAVDAAAILLYPQMRRLTPPPDQLPQAAFTDHAKALAWLDAERANLVTAITHASRHRPLSVVAVLADALRGYFWLRMYTVDWHAVARAGLATAEACDDLEARTAALLSLADAHYRLGQYRQAIDHSLRALAAGRESGWRQGQAAAHNNLGNLYKESGHLSRAAAHHRRALAVNRRSGRLASQVNNLGNLAGVYRYLGRLREAKAMLTEALVISRKVGSIHGEGVILGALGATAHDLGHLHDAMSQLNQALGKNREAGDRGGEVDTRNELAVVHGEAGHHRQAFEHADAALALAREMAYRHGEINVLNTVGAIHQRLGHDDDMADHHRRALTLARDIGYRYGEAQALIGLAAASHSLVDARAAAELCGTAGYRVLEGQACTVLAVIQLNRDQTAVASDHAAKALAIHRQTGHRLGEAGTLIILGHLADAAGHRDQALAYREDAHALLADIGAHWTDEVVALRLMAET
jgi:DNA-binding SARP family transcriptional activator/tetratricopeptide (TPR) repeat protein